MTSRVSPLRQECTEFLEHLVGLVPRSGDVLDIGIAGDVRGGGNKYMFIGSHYKTLDKLPNVRADFVVDITSDGVRDVVADDFDLVILSNTIEHIFEKEKAIRGCVELIRGREGYLIVDCPWRYPYHKSADSDDYWRVSASGLAKMMEKEGLTIIKAMMGEHCSSVLGKYELSN